MEQLSIDHPAQAGHDSCSHDGKAGGPHVDALEEDGVGEGGVLQLLNGAKGIWEARGAELVEADGCEGGGQHEPLDPPCLQGEGGHTICWLPRHRLHEPIA